jgi:glycosyltransferase involved in cell wall biosynthesis
MPDISILIPYRDRKESLLILLTQIKRNLFFFKQQLEVVLVDLGSEENIAAQLSKFPFVSYHYINYSGTFSRGWGLNLAFKKSKHPWIFMLDVDCIFYEKFLMAVSRYLENSETDRFFMFGGICNLTESITAGILQTRNLTNRMKSIINEHFDSLNVMRGAGNGLMHRDVFEKLSGYDEKIVGWGREDSDFRNRMKMAGIKEVTLPAHPDISLYHLFHGQSDVSYNNWWIFFQNDFVEKHNLENTAIAPNTGDKWGFDSNPPDQYNYESLFRFEVEEPEHSDKPPVLKVNGTYFNNPEYPLDLNLEFDGLDTIDNDIPLILLGGGLNYAYKLLSEKNNRILIIEKYKTVRELAIQWNHIDPARFLSVDFADMVDIFVRLKHMNPKNVLVHNPSFQFDQSWYAEVKNFITEP